MIISRRSIRLALMVIIAVIIGGLVSMVLTHQRIEGEGQVVADISVEADAALSDFSYTQTEAGVVRWNLHAASADHVSDTDETRLVGVEVKFFAENSAQNVVMTADEAHANLTQETIEAHGNVVLTMQQGLKLKTPQLFYSATSSTTGLGVVETPEHVIFTSAGMALRGQGMRYDIASGQLQIHSDVVAEIHSFGGR